ncbi:MAG: hypothetical protein JWM27_4945, partial [Gemmatimonadetes bacterium]|nr:hypothetical protein [Gemmatimonadota bacterium]
PGLAALHGRPPRARGPVRPGAALVPRVPVHASGGSRPSLLPVLRQAAQARAVRHLRVVGGARLELLRRLRSPAPRTGNGACSTARIASTRRGSAVDGRRRRSPDPIESAPAGRDASPARRRSCIHISDHRLDIIRIPPFHTTVDQMRLVAHLRESSTSEGADGGFGLLHRRPAVREDRDGRLPPIAGSIEAQGTSRMLDAAGRHLPAAVCRGRTWKWIRTEHPACGAAESS